ncbi:MAG: SWIM zinc finger family protein [Rubrivivax sp.]|jgi:hypothetical protein|nr:SWIM zinc finger family protein [Rubrivivax sp.]
MLTTDTVLALAPDDASAKAARGLVSPAKWPLRGADAAAVWGECQGSGSKPYQTQVDLSGPAFRCTCPSRKFPCKHGLALLLMKVQGGAAFGSGPPPAWVAEWLASRTEKAQKQEARAAAKAEAPVDPAAADAREAQRWRRIDAAAQDLSRWLADQLGAGLAACDARSVAAWQTMAARLVDGQAPGLAHRVRDAADRIADAPERTLARLAMLQLACDGLAHRSTLPEAEQADLRTLVGWPLDRADALARGTPVGDRWSVLAVALDEREPKLTERRVWLHGQASGRRALVLDHSFAGKGFEQAWVPGVDIDASLVFYPSAAPLRALCDTPAVVGITALPRAEYEWQRIAHRVAANPFVPLHPVLWRDAVLVHRQGWQAVAHGRALPLAIQPADAWALQARVGGHPLQLAGEWDGARFTPLTAWAADGAPPIWQRGAA